MITRVLKVMLIALVSVALAQGGASFANFVISPFGDEVLDIATGISTLTDGGRIVDRESGVELESDHITYLAGSFIETGVASLSGPFGAVTGGSVYVDIQEGTVRAHGELTYAGPHVSVRGTDLTYLADRGVISVGGGIQASEPGFDAARLLYHTASGTVLLVGPYSFDDGFISLSSSQEGALLELVGSGSGDDEDAPVRFQVSSEPSARTLATFGDMLP